MILETVSTEDGSLSVRDPVTGELHHNRAGAYTEAVVNYARPSGLLDGTLPAPDTIRVLDVCFGLGYNTFALLNELLRSSLLPRTLEILAIDWDGEVLKLVPKALESAGCVQVMKATDRGGLFTTFGDKSFRLGTDCTVRLRLLDGDIRRAVPLLAAQNEVGFDVVFHDPFSPKHVPQLWTADLFKCYRDLLDRRTGRLLTYSAASGVRGGMFEAGFAVWRSAALGGKSGGTVGSIDRSGAFGDHIFPLNENELARINSASGTPYRDPSFSESAAAIRTRRLAEQVDWRIGHMTSRAAYSQG
jgi:tRNA U34 5-methylaminomethyl-2-thiouridine-forming methyltransferase MnmC